MFRRNKTQALLKKIETLERLRQLRAATRLEPGHHGNEIDWYNAVIAEVQRTPRKEFK